MHERIKSSNLVKVELVSWFLNDMNVEGRLRLIFHLLEVSIGGVLGIGTESILYKEIVRKELFANINQP